MIKKKKIIIILFFHFQMITIVILQFFYQAFIIIIFNLKVKLYLLNKLNKFLGVQAFLSVSSEYTGESNLFLQKS